MTLYRPVALVTGASSGIGEVFARRLSQRGYRVILVARRKEKLEKLAAELQNSDVLAADLAVDSGLSAVEARITAEPNLEFLVNNAGFGVVGRFHKSNADDQHRMHMLHVIAIERLTYAALQGMAERNAGNIVNVSSVAGFINSPNNVGYCATKAWINSFTEGLYLELKSMNSAVKIQSLCPGFTYSEFHDVINMDRSLIPASLWMTAESVVDSSLKNLEKNRLYAVPGWRYRLIVGFLSGIPRFIKHSVALKYGDSRMRRGKNDSR
jgi:hypothetical protein